MTTATLQARINGGAPQTGGIYANLNDSVQLTAPDKSGWGNPPTKWQIYDFPKGFALPAGGWAVDTDGSYFFLGSNDPPPFTLSPWGFYGTRLFVLGGASSANGATDESTVIRVNSPNGLKDPGRREGFQFGSAVRGNTESAKDNLRTLEAALVAAGGGLPGVTTGVTLPLTINKLLTLIIDNGIGELDFSWATSGHVPGSETIVTVPAGQRTVVTVPASYAGDTINPAVEQQYDFFVAPDGAISTSVRTVSKDTVAPTILAATTGPKLAQIIVTYSKPVTITDVTKVSLSYSVGTPKTINTITGNGTAKHIYGLTGQTANTDALSLVWAANGAQSNTGVALAPGTTSVLNVASLFGRFWDMAQGVTTSSGNVTKVVEQVGGDAANCDLVNLSTMPYVASDAKLNGNPSCGPAPTGGDLHSGTFASSFAAPYTICMVGYDDGTATNQYWLFGAGGQADINLNPTYAMYGGTYLMSGVTDTNTAKAIVATFNNATSSIRVNAKTPQASGTTATNPSFGTVIVWNALHTAPYNVNGGFGFLGIAPGAMSAANVSAWLDYAAARWNLAVGA